MRLGAQHKLDCPYVVYFACHQINDAVSSLGITIDVLVTTVKCYSGRHFVKFSLRLPPLTKASENPGLLKQISSLFSVSVKGY